MAISPAESRRPVGCFSFNSLGPISRPDIVVTFNGFTGCFSFSTIARVCADATCSMVYGHF